MQGKLKHDLNVTAWGAAIVLPAGTAVTLIKGADGLKGDLWAVSSVKLLQDLTGNAHDPVYRYLWIDAEHVEREAQRETVEDAFAASRAETREAINAGRVYRVAYYRESAPRGWTLTPDRYTLEEAGAEAQRRATRDNLAQVLRDA